MGEIGYHISIKIGSNQIKHFPHLIIIFAGLRGAALSVQELGDYNEAVL